MCIALAGGLHAQTAVIAGRVVDANTGTTMPATVAIRTSTGSIITENPGFAAGFRSRSEFEKFVPAGPASVTVSRGFDYGAVREVFDLRPGERKELTFTLRRRTPLRARGWYCGDNHDHDHMVHGERKISTDFAYVALAGRAEALDYLALAQQWAIPNATPESLSASGRAVSTPDFLLTWNLEAPKNYWRGDASHCMGYGWTLGMAGSAPGVPDAIAALMAINAHDYESEKTPTPNFVSHALVHSLGGIVS